MATLNKFNIFVENLARGVHVFNTSGGHNLVFALTNALPGTGAASTVLANFTGGSAEISYTNLQGNPTSRLATVTVASQTAGVFTLKFSDMTLTAQGGPVGPFRYLVLYDDTPTSPADPLIGYYDYGSSITLADGETISILDQVNGILQVT